MLPAFTCHETCLLPVAFVFALCLPSFGAGQAVGIKHPVYDYGATPERAAELESAVARVMQFSEAELVALVPDKHFSRFCHCPECFGGVDADGVFSWTIDRPEELKCRYCGFVWTPDGPYKEDKVLSGLNDRGETRTFSYYEHPQRGTKHYFTLNRYYYQRGWLISQIQALGRAFLATGKPEYARRVAMVIDRMAQVYPHLAVIKVGGIPNRYFEIPKNQQPPYTWDAGKWGWHSPGDELPAGVINAYDMVYDSPELDRLSQERGYDMREHIESNLLRPTMAAVRADPNHVSNYVAYLGTAATMGRVINEPEWVHWAFSWIAGNVYVGCFYDGMWHESPSYHYMTTSGLHHCLNTVRGYSDPEGYVDAADGKRFSNLDPAAQLPFWAKVQHAPEVVDFPTGCSPTFHDTWSGERRSEPRERTVSTILPGMGHASLGRGGGPHQIQAQLHFSGGYGHSHRDNLAMLLWAKQREMLCDIGYTWSDIRSWTVSTISHNLVAIDCREQKGSASDGDLLGFFPDNAGVSMVEADGRRAYADLPGVEVYRRGLAIVPVSTEDAYVVDLFRVRGGAVHDWLLHGDADEDTQATCALPLGEPAENMTVFPPGGQVEPSGAYEFIRQVRQGAAEGAFEARFSYSGEPQRGLRIHALPPGRSEVFLGQSPSIRRTGRGTAADNRKIWDYWMPSLLVRRHSDAGPLNSCFAAVYEPYSGETFIGKTERVRTEGDDVVALRVTRGETTDTIASTLDTAPYPVRRVGDIALQGRLGVVRQVGGRTTAMWLFEGERLATADAELAPQTGQLSGAITGATRREDGAEQDAFTTDAALPVGEALRGTWMIVTHGNGYTHGYPIDYVEQTDGGSRIVLSMDHGLRIEGNVTREVFFPQREIEGENRFVVPLCAAWEAE